MALIGLSLGFSTTAEGGVTPAGTAFTYQGQLREGGSPIDGFVDVQFKLFNDAVLGGQIGATVTQLNVDVDNGLLTVDIDFGPTAFEGSQRWLEIAVRSPAGAGSYVTLNPRQAVTAAPYSLRSLAPWATGVAPFNNDIFFNTGNVGIGTDEPAVDLELSKPNATLRITSTAANGTSQLELKGDVPGGLGANVLGSVRFLDEANAVRAEMYSSVGLFANAFNFAVDGTIQMALTDTGNLGVGTSLPVAKLQLAGGTDSEPGTGGFLVIGDLNSTNISFDNNEIMARNNGVVAELFLNNDGGDVTILPNQGGTVGIGTPATSAAQLTVFNSLFVNGGAEPRLDIGPNGFILMDTGADITITNGGLEVNTPSGGQTFFNRTASDGTLINFRNNGVAAGGIAVFGSTVSYNTFTGSHNAWTDCEIEHGALVVLNGDNRRAHPGANCEVTYGIAPSTTANHPACLGSYLSPPDAANPASQHLVAAVGNGELWVVDNDRGDISPGEYLISSDVTGCAMKDDASRFAIGHIIARAAEAVNWSAIEASGNGPKRALVSVFFESFDRHGDATEMSRLAAVVAEQRAEIAALQARLETLNDVAERLSRLEAASSEPAIIHAAKQGGRP
jgi:hypothetical protein